MEPAQSAVKVKESPRHLKVPFTNIEIDCQLQTVCVIGAATHVGGRVVQRLLALGHTVRAVVDIDTQKRIQAGLLSLPGASRKLQLRKADFSTGRGIMLATQGCDVLIHCASYECCNLTTTYYESEFDDEEEQQLLMRVLEAAECWESVKRVILTMPSSNVVAYHQVQRQQPYMFTEHDWNTTANEFELSQQYWKVQLERFAWKRMRQQQRWDLVSIHLDFVTGPPVSAHKIGSCLNFVAQCMMGNIFCMPQIGIGITDVRDVAALHCCAVNYQRIKSRRYIGVAESIWISQIFDLIKRIYSQSKVPRILPSQIAYWLGGWFGFRRDMIEHSVDKTFSFENIQTRDLFIPNGFISLRESLSDMMEYFMETGIVSLPIERKRQK
eukprot:TRINITY_DN4893_c0_g2_i4.p1 TRINITY_DN4893_c0_g2~~TRINITY_DN4893_c0_g2_i4.p1  ORF type:complete len:383 (-),score=17.36 TRINITY_DN4893_c0_g2_i4:237-1385(-)